MPRALLNCSFQNRISLARVFNRNLSAPTQSTDSATTREAKRTSSFDTLQNVVVVTLAKHA